MGASTHEMLQPATAQETLPTAGTIGRNDTVIVDTPDITQRPLKPFPCFHVILCFFVLGWGRYSTQLVNAGVHAGARYCMQAANEFERSLVVALTYDGPIFEEAVDNVMRQVPSMPVVEGSSTIPKNTV